MANEKRLIDANAFVIPKYKETDDLFVDGYRQGKIDALIGVMAHAPTVDAVEVVHGRWNEINQSTTGLQWKYRCDKCGCPQDYAHNYCPNCGAKMDGGNEDGNL